MGDPAEGETHHCKTESKQGGIKKNIRIIVYKQIQSIMLKFVLKDRKV